MTAGQTVTFPRALTSIVAVIMAVTVSGCAGDPLARHAVNKISDGWYTWGNVKTAVVKDRSAPGGRFQRVVIPVKPAQPWDDGVGAIVTKPLKKGDVIVYAFWARAETLPGGNDFAQVWTRVFEQAPPQASITPETSFLIGRQWKLFHSTGSADKDYPAGKVSAGMVIGGDAQTLDFGPLYISDFGPDFDPAKLQLK